MTANADDQPPVLRPVETLPPVVPTALEPGQAPRHYGAPVHPLAALLLLVVDNLWNLADWTVMDWVISIPLSFGMVAVPAFFIQKSLRQDSVARAFAFALLLGVIAAVPTSLTGTPVGLALLAWTGIDRLMGRPPTRPSV